MVYYRDNEVDSILRMLELNSFVVVKNNKRVRPNAILCVKTKAGKKFLAPSFNNLFSLNSLYVNSDYECMVSERKIGRGLLNGKTLKNSIEQYNIYNEDVNVSIVYYL